MEKLKMQSENLVNKNIGKIAELFPNCVTEGYDNNGKLIKMVDFDLLKQELSDIIVEGNDERYTMTWPDKKQAILTANAPINKTLRPCREESVDFDNTKNLYIEGDNLDVLKLLRETYLGKIKMIYIDPPYNTGNDFVYNDDFAEEINDYIERSGQFDEEGNKLFQNTESNGRFHTDWLNMIYPRIKLSKDLLTDDGAIFISIDDNEVDNLKKICSEIFGTSNFVGEIIRKTKSMTGDDGSGFNLQHESLLIYAKNKDKVVLRGSAKSFDNYSNPDNDKNGDWCSADPSAKSGGPTTYFEIVNPYTGKVDIPPKGRYWAFTKSTLDSYIQSGKIVFKKSHKETERGFIFKRYKKDATSLFNPLNSLFVDNEYMNQAATFELNRLFGNALFSYPKPVNFIKEIVKSLTNNKDIILDFFSGSATTAHAVMQLNSEDGEQRRFIMVQLPEETDEKSETYKLGYKNLCDIGKERIKKSGLKIIKHQNELKNVTVIDSAEQINVLEALKGKETAIRDFLKTQPHIDISKNVDTGFRVLKLDSSCMKDIYYSPVEMSQDLLAGLEDNIKEDRTPEDLLFQVMLDMGVLLSSKIEEKIINNKKVFIVGEYDNDSQPNLICCFDNNLTDDVVKEIAKMKPLYAVFRDSSIATDSVNVNFDQIFETYSPTTTRKVI